MNFLARRIALIDFLSSKLNMGKGKNLREIHSLMS